MITLGVDIGSIFTKAVVLEGERVLASLVRETTGNTGSELVGLLDELLSGVGLSRGELAAVVATGQGEELFKEADFGEDDFACVAAAARRLLPEASLAVDIGGQSITTVLSDSRGGVVNFMRNDKCASGSGRFIEVIGAALGIAMESIDETAGRSRKKISISTQCAVFAESEIVSCVNRGEEVSDITAALCDSTGRSVVSQALRAGPVEAYTVTGGVARFAGVVRILEERLKGNYLPFPMDPQLAAAYGAALIGQEEG